MGRFSQTVRILLFIISKNCLEASLRAGYLEARIEFNDLICLVLANRRLGQVNVGEAYAVWVLVTWYEVLL